MGEGEQTSEIQDIEKEALLKLGERGYVIKAEPIELLTPGVLFHFGARKQLPAALVDGLICERLAKERGIRRSKPGQGLSWEYVSLAQLLPSDLQEPIPLAFLTSNARDYATGEIDTEGMLSQTGVVINKQIPGTKTIQELDGKKVKRSSVDELLIPEVSPKDMIGIVLVDSKDTLYPGPFRNYTAKEINQARQNTINWLKTKILPYHQVPIYSQTTGKVLFPQSRS